MTHVSLSTQRGRNLLMGLCETLSRGCVDPGNAAMLVSRRGKILMGTKHLQVLLFALVFVAGPAGAGFVEYALSVSPANAKPVSISQSVTSDVQEDMPAAFREGLEKANQNLDTPEGRAYEATIGKSVGLWLPAAAAGCAKRLQGTAFSPFTLLLRIGAEGQAEEVLMWPETTMADCLKPKFLSAVYPTPPMTPWWFSRPIKIEFKNAEPDRGQAPATEPGVAGIVYGDQAAVAVGAPEGWVLDNQSGVSQGVHCVMYPKDSSWKKSSEVMYVTVTTVGSGERLEAVIEKDVAKFRKEFRGIKIDDLGAIQLKSGSIAQLRGFSGGGYGNFEAVGYALHGTDLITFVLTCRTSRGFEEALPLFKAMISGSYSMDFKGKEISPQ
jgi:hypothetical protein